LFVEVRVIRNIEKDVLIRNIGKRCVDTTNVKTRCVSME